MKYEATLHAETEKAWLLHFVGKLPEPIWVPKSACMFANSQCDMPEWLAIRVGLEKARGDVITWPKGFDASVENVKSDNDYMSYDEDEEPSGLNGILDDAGVDDCEYVMGQYK